MHCRTMAGQRGSLKNSCCGHLRRLKLSPWLFLGQRLARAPLAVYCSSAGYLHAGCVGSASGQEAQDDQ